MGGIGITGITVVTSSLGVLLCGAQEPLSVSGDALSQRDERLDALLESLGSDSFIQRDWAARQLAQLGPGVIPRLVEAAQSPDETTAQAATRLLLKWSRGSDGRTAAPALQAVISLQDRADALAPTVRELLTTGYEEIVRASLAQLMVLGAKIDRDREQQVVAIGIRSEEFTDRDIRWLIPLTGLQRGDFRGTAITDHGVQQLASLPGLRYLNLSDTRITSTGLRHLGRLKDLRELIVYRLALEEEDIAWVREHLPRCRLTPSAAQRPQPGHH